MTAQVFSQLRCDSPGCRAVWPSNTYRHWPGNSGTARRFAAKHDWKHSSIQGDFCPEHEIPVSHTVLSEHLYTVADLKKVGAKYFCPVPDCGSIGWAVASSLLTKHVNRLHIRCEHCGWVGISLSKHKAAMKRAGLPECV